MVPAPVNTRQFHSLHSGNADNIQAPSALVCLGEAGRQLLNDQQGAFHMQEDRNQPLVSNGAHLLSHRNE